MYEDRRPIYDFPGYEIDAYGNVYNLIRRNKPMIWSPTLTGEPTVGLCRDGHQYRRSVKTLVARAFVEGEDHIFNCPMLLDGDKNNNRADNIVWRPRWFAWRYARQLVEIEEWYYDGPIVSMLDNKEYNQIIDAAMDRGLLAADIHVSLQSSSRVFPTGDRFDYI